MHKQLMRGAIAFVVVALASSVAIAADEWGTLKGRFLYDGVPPKPAKIGTLTAECSKHAPVDESLVVGPDKGLANVAIVLRTEGVKAHPKFAEPAEVSLDNKDCRFEPRMLVVQIGQPVVVKNSDQFGHNTKADFFKNTQFNVTMPAGAKQTFKFTAEETLPTIISCGIHPWMRAHLWVRKSPYHAVSDAKGAFEIADLPVGKELEFHLWQGKNLSNVALKGVTGGKSDTKGRFKIKIKAGSNDLGDIKLSPTLFKKT